MCAKDVLGGRHIEFTDHGDPIVIDDELPKGREYEDLEEEDPGIDYESMTQEDIAQMQNKRNTIRAKVDYELKTTDPFQLLSIKSKRFSQWYKRRLTDRQLASVRRAGIEPDSYDPAKQCAIFDNLMKRRKNDLCTYKQVKLLNKFGVDATNLSFRQASDQIDRAINKKR
tara:strand:- start:503 stop:1012 length:510 start_codon:yes stop_codon:yes gene_type:complete